MYLINKEKLTVFNVDILTQQYNNNIEVDYQGRL